MLGVEKLISREKAQKTQRGKAATKSGQRRGLKIASTARSAFGRGLVAWFCSFRPDVLPCGLE
jgi:hypothetical protein